MAAHQDLSQLGTHESSCSMNEQDENHKLHKSRRLSRQYPLTNAPPTNPLVHQDEMENKGWNDCEKDLETVTLTWKTSQKERATSSTHGTIPH